MIRLAHVRGLRRWCFLLIFVGAALPAVAAVPLASREADRQAKAAVPGAREALVYVYRQEGGAATPVAVTLNGRDAASLAPRTFTMWRVQPGRVEVGAEGTKSTLALRADGGRVYYVQLSRSSAGVSQLHQVSFPVGRTQIHRAQLVARTTAVARPAPSPAPAKAPARTPRTRQPANFALALKLGSFKLGEESQTIVSNTERLFDSSASSVFALEGEYFVRPDLSFGVEVVSYSNDFTTPSSAAQTGSTDTTAVFFNTKRYFLPAGAWQPYVGVGLGGAGVDFSGWITGSTGGFALQAMGGLQWRADRLAARAEYKYVSADTEDDNNQKVDMSGSGLFLGVGFYF